MYDKTITLYNRSHNANGDTWYPTVLTGVNLIMDKALNVQRYGENNENSASLHVKYTLGAGNNSRGGGKKYKEPKAWAEIASEDIDEYISFKTGNDGDFFIVGDHGLEVIDDNSFTSGFLNYAKK